MTSKLNRLFFFALAFLPIHYGHTVTLEEAVFEGTIKNYPIVLQISMQDDEIFGSYFYKKQSRDIPISGLASSTTIDVEEGQIGSGQGLSININSPTIDGYWYDKNKNTKLPLLLTHIQSISPSTDDSAALKKIAQDNYYEYLRHKTLPIEAGKIESFMGQPIQWYTEPKSKFSFFNRQSNSNQFAIINAEIEFLFRNDLSLNYSCSDMEYSLTPSFLSKEVTSFLVSGSFYCEGAAHPNIIYNNINLHNKSGKRLTLSDLISIPSPDQKQVWIMDQLMTLYPEQFKDENCPYTEAESWNVDEIGGWIMTDKGIQLTANFPHALAVCSMTDWAVLPFSMLDTYPGLVTLSSAQ